MKNGIGPYADMPGPYTAAANAVYAPTQYVVQDFYHPQQVPVIHPIEVINQHHVVPVPYHMYTCTTKDVYCSSARRRKRRKK